jgi:glycosyltransferase involved in cell wall biosynthesis
MNAADSLLYRIPVYEQTIATSYRLSVLVPVYNERHVVEASLRRVLALEHELISSLELIVVDDSSTDGTLEVLKRLADEDVRITLIAHETNRGKGAAIRTALSHSTGDIVVIHDADLEYNPADIPSLLVPFAKEGADAVFGSRYLSAPYRRALMYRHTMMNKVVTLLGNWFTDLTLTDLETCYKAINATLLKSIPLRSNDFRFEVEIVFKLAKRRAQIFEAPIRYLPRSNAEGKKIRARDGLLALMAMLRFWLIDDLYKEDAYGARMLIELERTRRFILWMGETLRPFVGDRVLEIGAGIGNLTNQLIPRELFIASDINPNYLHYLRSYSLGKPYLRVMEIDAQDPDAFLGLEGQFDTVIMLNVLERLTNAQQALANLWSALQPGGRAIVLVPQHPGLYGTLDEALEHRLRYTTSDFERALNAAGFRIEKLFDFNRFSAPVWWLNGRVLRRRKFSRVQLKTIDIMIPIIKRVDRLLPWSGVSLIAIAVKD